MAQVLHRHRSGVFGVVPDVATEKPCGLRPAEDLGARAAIAAELFGEDATPVMIGRFRVTRRLGEGGMGRVYEAIDTELDRRIALKLLVEPNRNGGIAGERMLREARSLAKLSHPHVVGIFDVGEHAGSVFLAMEFVDGTTLADWQAEPRAWRTVLDKYLQAGEGLNAMHAAGLVHRDFKPANVLLDGSGRVKLADFGVALVEASAATTTGLSRFVDCDPTESGVRLTATGAMLGTPLFMSPEQLRARGVDTRSDQFSFCFALYDAVFGTPPFTIAQRRDHDLRLELGNRRAPGWLRAVLLRGLALQPRDRWPDMEALLRALRRGANRLRRFAIAGGLVASVATVASASAWIAAPSCDDAGDAMARVWNERRADDVRAAFAGTGLPYAQTTAQTVISQLDDRAREWETTRIDVCSDHRLWRARSARFHDASMACLDHRLADLESVADELERIDTSGVQHAGSLVATLTPTRHCTELDWLEQSMQHDQTAADSELRARIVAAELALALGRHEAALHEAEASSERARELDAGVAQAEAAGVRARALAGSGRSKEAERAYLDAIRLAEAAHLDELAVELWRDLVGLAIAHDDYRTAERWLELFDGAVLRIGDPPTARGDYLVAVGHLADRRGDHVAAEHALREALGRFADAGADESPRAVEAMRRLASTLAILGRAGAAEELRRRAATTTRRLWGEGHPAIEGATEPTRVGAQALREPIAPLRIDNGHVK